MADADGQEDPEAATVSLFRSIIAALGEPPRRQRPPGQSTGYQRRLLPDVEAGRVFLNWESVTAWRQPAQGGDLEDVTSDTYQLSLAGLIFVTPPPEEPGEPQVVPYQLTALGEDTLIASRRRKENR